MGAPALEARLRRRLLVLVAPAIVAVGVASVGVMQHALVAADSETARTRAGDLLRDFRREVSAGDPVDVALDEVVSGAEADGFRFVVRGIPNHPERPSAEPLPHALADLADRACATATDDHGAHWRACGAKDGALEAIAAVAVDAHAAAVRTLAEWMLAVVIAALGATIAAARWAVQTPLASVKRLVDWSEHFTSHFCRRSQSCELQALQGRLSGGHRQVPSADPSGLR